MKPVLALATGNCGPGELEDLDGNGTREFVVCDDRFANMYCSFADSPFPRVIYSVRLVAGESMSWTRHDSRATFASNLPGRSTRRRRGCRSQAASMWVSISAVCCGLSSG